MGAAVRSRDGIPDLATEDLRPSFNVLAFYRPPIAHVRSGSVNLAMPLRAILYTALALVYTPSAKGGTMDTMQAA